MIQKDLCKVIDRGMWIWSSINRLTLKMYRNEYLNIVKAIIHNFTYDDNMDERFAHNWKINKRFTPGIINFYLDINDVNLYGMNVHIKQPFFSLKAKNLRFKFYRDSLFFKTIGAYLERAWINYFTFFD